MAKNNNNTNAKTSVIIDEAFLQKNARKARRGGGRGRTQLVGLWCEKDARGNRVKRGRHIKTTALGVGVNQAFMIFVKKNKIILATLSDSQEQAVLDADYKVFKTAVRSAKNKTYQNYASIEGIDDELYDKMVDINGGVYKVHGLHDTIEEGVNKGLTWQDVYVVQSYDDFIKEK